MIKFLDKTSLPFDVQDSVNKILKKRKIDKIKISDEFLLSYAILKIWGRLKQKKEFKDIDTMNNLRLQKTLYFVYGFYYSNKNEEIMKNVDFHSWRLGPVIPSIYYQVKSINILDSLSNVDPESFLNSLDNKFKDLEKIDENLNNKIDVCYLEKILIKLSEFSTFELVDKSHRTEPWRETKSSNKIDIKKINNYFKGKTLDEINNI